MVRGQGKNNKRKKNVNPQKFSTGRKRTRYMTVGLCTIPPFCSAFSKDSTEEGSTVPLPPTPLVLAAAPWGMETKGLEPGEGQIPAPPGQAPRLTWRANLRSCDQTSPGRLSCLAGPRAAGCHTALLAAWHWDQRQHHPEALPKCRFSGRSTLN